MRRSGFLALLLVLVALAACAQQRDAEPARLAALSGDVTTELYFSEYIEGSSYNKALEIFNGTEEDVDLSDYSVQQFSNGNTTPSATIALEGTLPAGSVYVLAQDRAHESILAEADETTGAGLFNGDDAVVLRRGSAIVDAIGQIGFDPGSQWGSGLTSTADNTLRRAASACAGDADASDAFDPAVAWVGFATDAFDGLGTHATTCAAGPHAEPEAPVEGDPDPTAITPIYEVQGSGASSPLVGDTVTIRGVVVGDFQDRSELSGFFVQEQTGDGVETTSDGIFVFHRGTDVAVGDRVELTGKVVEYYGLTEITDADVELLGTADLPDATVVTLPLASDASWERYEGMYVTIESASGPLVATEVYHLGRGGIVMLADERIVQFTQTNEPSVAGYDAHREEVARRTILLDDGSTRQNPDPIRYATTGPELTADDTLRVGDTTPSVTGVLTYSYNGWSGTDAYRIHPTESVDFDPGNPRPDAPPTVGGQVQVGSFNVLNFFNGDGQGGGFPTPRGAYDELELERQLGKLVSAIVPMDAEVLGLIEIENDAGTDSALADLVEALNAEAGEGTYAYVDTGAIGTDEIKVALVYQPGAVNPVGRFRILNSTRSDDHHTLDPRFDDSRNRPALAQTFVEKATGARFTVIVNHLKSKGSPCGGDPDADDGQGNCNLTRVAAAEALADWAELLRKETGDPDVLVMGDLNAYAMEDPIRALETDGFENLLEPDEFSYVFMGESGTLDHALATSELAEQVTGAAVWNINAEEPSVLDYNTNFKTDRLQGLLYSDHAFRSSDHDPVLVGLDLVAPPRGGSSR